MGYPDMIYGTTWFYPVSRVYPGSIQYSGSIPGLHTILCGVVGFGGYTTGGVLVGSRIRSYLAGSYLADSREVVGG